MRANRLIVIGALLGACGGSQSAGGPSGGGGGSSAGSAGQSGSSSAGDANGSGKAGSSAGGASAGGASAGGVSSSGASSGGAGASAGSTGVSGASNGGLSGASNGGASGTSGTSGGGQFISQLLFKSGGCLPRPLPVNQLFSQTTCSVVEANGVGTCNCSQAARAPVDAGLVTAIRAQLLNSGNCGVSGQPACEKFCMCEILQEIGAYGTECKTDPVAAAQTLISAGFCYADDPASPALANCPANEKQSILFVSTTEEPTPSPDALAFLICPG